MANDYLAQKCVMCVAPDNQRPTMDIPEMAGLLGISRGAAYLLAASDELPVRVIRLGRRRVVSRAEVHQLLHGE